MSALLLWGGGGTCLLNLLASRLLLAMAVAVPVAVAAPSDLTERRVRP